MPVMTTTTISHPLIPPRSSSSAQRGAWTDVMPLPSSDPEERAACTIQRVYRGYRTRRELEGCGLSASSRCLNTGRNPLPEGTDDNEDASTGANIEDATDPAQIISPARKNWQRAVSVAIQASRDGEPSVDSKSHGHSDDPRNSHTPTCPAKTMGLEYFLEMVDSKHRHGSHLRAYHAAWKNSPSNENFFYWLDHGEGKDIELPRCPRERLEKDQVRYLSPEERFNYLVNVDDAGLLRWAKNNELVDTDSKRYKDSVNGVVRVDENVPRAQDPVSTPASDQTTSREPSSPIPPVNEKANSSSPSTREDYELGKAVNNFSRIRPAFVYDHFAGSLSIKDGMWIFVADTSFRIYIGIKEPGAFQHSSFLRGGRISAAGLIKTKDGQIRGLAPLSGHYRPHLANFRAFHHSLQERGVDLSRTSMTKSYAILAGIEGYTTAKRKIKNVHEKLDEAKQKLHSMHLHSDDPKGDEKP
ncbi:IQ calmodulin-binding motif protein [Penicillium brasilianum]|uniref:IQ calmodulin-binding motif protein n=1 Tax=Penicillium brasilianum TaxID=104259 RepID=A0A1S9RT77_PENBI|nr:IQ calmodulin-binding motif protein [Penicillium brasilianum]